MTNRLDYLILLLIAAVVLFGCAEDDVAERAERAPARNEANPIVISADSVKPLVVPAQAPVVIPAGDPEPIVTEAKRFKADQPDLIEFDLIETFILGQDSTPDWLEMNFQDSLVRLGTPEMELGKPASIPSENPIHISTYNRVQGLKQKNTKCFLHDSKGNYWFGSGGLGLSKFDGKIFRHYTTEQGLCDNYITALEEDNLGRIWVGTQEGVNIIDGTSVIHFTGDGIREVRVIEDLVEDADGSMWLLTKENGVYKFSESGISKMGFEHGVDFTTTRDILVDNEGVVWISGYDKLIRYDSDQVVVRHIGNTYDMPLFQASFGPDGSMWISSRYGILHWNNDGLWRYGREQGLPHNSYWSSITARDGSIWFAFPYGVMKYDGDAFTTFNMDEGLCFSYMWDVFEDNYGNIWMASGEACMSKYSESLMSHLILERDNVVDKAYSITSDDQGRTLVGTLNGGLYVGDSTGWHNYNPTNGLPFIDVSRVKIGSDGRVYISSYDGRSGFVIMDEGQFFHYGLDQGTPRGYIRHIEFDQQGALWMTHTESGVTRFDGDTFTTYDTEDGLNSGDVYSILASSDGNLWLGTGEGLCKFDGKQFTQYRDEGAPTNRGVWCLMEDSHGDLWMGTRFGVLRFDGENFTQFTDVEGLSDNFVASILEASDGSIWMGTEFGASRLKFSDPDTRLDSIRDDDYHISTYVYEDGFYGVDVHPNSIFEDADGTIWIGAQERITKINPAAAIDSEVSLEITGVDLYNETINWRDVEAQPDSSFRLENNAILKEARFDQLSPWYDVPLGLSLAHNNNYVHINYIGITNKEPDKIRYQYMLEGQHQDWGGLTNETSADFGNLSSGSYTFRVKAMDGQGNWSDETSYSFEIRPPWWNTWLARILYAVVLVGGILLYTSWRTRSLKKQRTLLEETITERTAELADQKERAEQSEKYKEQFLANMSHEIRTPMHAISGMTGILARNEKLPHQEKFLEAIHRSSGNLLVILNDILDLSKIEAGKIEIETLAFAPRKVIENVVEIMNIKASEKEYPLTAHVDETLPDYIYGDPTRLSQILLNLLGNAIKFTDNGSVTLSVRNLDDHFEVEVRDTGIGIPKAKLHTIFQSFEQVNESTTRKYGGTGLGLSITRQLLELQDGSIRCESEEGVGSTFTLQLPLRPVAPEDVVEDEVDEKELRAMAEELSGMRILLVEDNDFNVMVATDDLNYYFRDVQLDVAENGQQAVNQFKTHKYDLILMDMQMPVMDGYAATKVIRELESASGDKARVPIIAMTASLLKQEIQRCFDAGMDNYIPKPYKIEQMITVLHSEMKKPNPREQRIGQ